MLVLIAASANDIFVGIFQLVVNHPTEFCLFSAWSAWQQLITIDLYDNCLKFKITKPQINELKMENYILYIFKHQILKHSLLPSSNIVYEHEFSLHCNEYIFFKS